MPVSLPVADGTFLIDTGFVRPGLAASYLLADSGRAAFVETGTALSAPRLLAGLAENDLDRGDVDRVILTHVHLDHAAGAGALMAELPNARLVVHPRGARHMVDPSKLIAGATAVYGKEFLRRSYGVILPVPAARVDEAPEGTVVELGGRDLHVWDTPGHARHHVCIWDTATRALFSGDVFGLAYRELDSTRGPFIFPTTSPVQFEPDVMHASIDRIVAAEPACVLLTHFGRVDNVATLGATLHELVDRFVAIAGDDDDHAPIAERIMSLLLERARRHGCPLEPDPCRDLLAMDVELNAQGLMGWRNKQKNGK